MRTLATIALSFAAGVFAVVLLGVGVWQLWAAGACLLAGLVLLGLKRTMPARLPAAGDADPLCPVRGAGVHGAVSGTGTGSGDSPLRADGGVLRHGALPPGGDGVGRPCHHPPLRLGGQGGGLRRCGICRFRAGAAALRHGPMAGRCPHPGKRCDGLHLTGRVRSAVCPWTADGGGGQRRKHPVAAQRAVYALREKIAAIWPDGDTAAFVTAELTGDRSGMAEENAAVMTQAGVAHLLAVSGLHCAFLVSLLGLLLPVRRRALGAGLSMAVLLFYMVMVGLTPSVVRACIMQIFLLAAPLLRRESDGLPACRRRCWCPVGPNPSLQRG